MPHCDIFLCLITDDEDDDDSDVSQNEMDGPKQSCTGTTSANNSGDGINGAGGHYEGVVAGGGDSGVFPPDHSNAPGHAHNGDSASNGMIAVASNHPSTTPFDTGGGGSIGDTPTSQTSPVPLTDAAQYALTSSDSVLPPLKWISVPAPGDSPSGSNNTHFLLGTSGGGGDSAARLVISSPSFLSLSVLSSHP